MNGKVLVAASLILIVWGIIVEANLFFVVAMCVWVCMMISAYSDLERNFLQFAFGLTFFTFLMGREFLEQYSLHSSEDFLPEINEHLALCVLISLLSFWLAFSFFNRRKQNIVEDTESDEAESDVTVNFTEIEETESEEPEYDDTEFEETTRWSAYYMAVRKYARKMFFVSMPFAFITSIVVSAIVFVVGYNESYLVVPVVMESFPILYVFDKIGIMMPASFCIFCAALPSKSEFYNLGKWFLLYSFLTVFEGARGTFLINILVFGSILAYMQCIVPGENWFDKHRLVRWAAIGVPFVMISSVAIAVARAGDDWKEIDITESITDFVYQQGVTGKNLKRAYEMESSIPEPVSGFYTLEFLHSGLPARLLGIKVYSGNNEEHATEGNSMKFALAYATMGDNFLDGQGTGSSYIIETYYDFGYIGVALGSILYAFLLSLIHRLSMNDIFVKALAFIVIGDILWATRAGFTDFLQHLFAPTILFLLAFIFIKARREASSELSDNLVSL